MNNLKIENISKNPLINIAIDTIKKNKQAIFFVSTKASAEKLSKDIANKIQKLNLVKENLELSENIKSVITPPTSQCKSLSDVVKFHVSFHHSGLLQKQRELIENNFRENNIKIICATPTLAAGVDLPAYRVIIRDLKRFTTKMDFIKVLEYKQMSGRAGRLGMAESGESIILVKEKDDPDEITAKFIFGTTEEIYSKLSVEPILRKTVLGLVSTYYNNYDKLIDFFKKTFFAYQYNDFNELKNKLDKIIKDLKKLKFIKEDENDSTQNDFFVSANNLDKKSKELKPTKLGIRISQLYLEPYSARELILFLNFLSKNEKIDNNLKIIEFLKHASNTLELKPLFSVLKKEIEEVSEFNYKYDIDFYSFDKAKFVLVFLKWINENTQEDLFTYHNITPGLLKAKLDVLNWFIHSCYELSSIIYPEKKHIKKTLNQFRNQFKYGVKEELINLITIKNIGKIRARLLYENKIRNYEDIIKQKELCKKLIGEKLTNKIINKI